MFNKKVSIYLECTLFPSYYYYLTIIIIDYYK